MSNDTLRAWHKLLQEKDLAALDDVLAEDVVFHSPVLHTPQQGKQLTKLYLTAAANVIVNDSFHYVREVVGDTNAVLEFVTEIDGIHVNGVDMMHFDGDGKIDDFKVMIRPLKAINLLYGMMRKMLEQMQ